MKWFPQGFGTQALIAILLVVNFLAMAMVIVVRGNGQAEMAFLGVKDLAMVAVAFYLGKKADWSGAPKGESDETGSDSA